MSRHLLTLAVLLSALAVLGGVLGAPRAWAPPACNPGGGGHGTAEEPFLISNAAELEAVAGANCPSGSRYFRQTADIVLTGPIASIGTTDFAFNGTYDGGGHRITGLAIPSLVASDTGLFGLVQSAEIKDLTIVGASIADGASGKSNIGVLVGRMVESIVSNVHAMDVKVVLSRDDARIGALVGTMESSSISGSSASGIVESGGPVGGLVGEACASSIASSSSSVALRSRAAYGAGGLVGVAELDCYQGFRGTGCIAPCYVPAAIGIFDSQATGAVDGVETVGGLIGFAGPMTIERSFATGAVQGGDMVGGLVGASADAPISDAYALGAVTGQTRVGGLLGATGGSPIARSFAAGRITSGADGVVGGLVGGLGPSLAGSLDSFWDVGATGQATSLIGIGKSTAEMKALATFAGAGWVIAAGWDASRTWGICAGRNDGYPFLTRSFATAVDACGAPPAAVPATSTAAPLTVRDVHTSGNAIVSRVAVPGPGVVVQTGGVLSTRGRSATTSSDGVRATLMVACTVSRAVKATGSILLRCPLNARTLRLLQKRALRIRLITRFAPTTGSATSVATTIALPKRPAKPKGSGAMAVTG